MDEMITLTSEVPFGHLLYAVLNVNDLHLDDFIRHDQMESHYLAWETVRKQLNPFFRNGTGFEGYLVGRCRDSQAALESILDINQNILDSIARQYHFEYGFRSRLMKTLTREADDPLAIHVWSTCLGAELAKLRAQILRDNVAQAYREHTYELVGLLPPIVYHEIEEDITQDYAIGSEKDYNIKLAVTWQMLKPDQQDAWLVAQNIGEFGHPLVRKLLNHAHWAA